MNVVFSTKFFIIVAMSPLLCDWHLVEYAFTRGLDSTDSEVCE